MPDLKLGQDYLLEVFEEGRASVQRRLTGKQLGNNLELRMSKRGTSLLVRYRSTR